MSMRSRKPATESLEEPREMKLLQSIIDQESETTDDAKRPNNQNSFDANRRFVDRHSHDKSTNEKILPAAKTCGDLRLARSLTNGRKPSSSNSSRLSVGGISLRSASSGLNRQLVPPPLQSPYESSHKQRMVTKYREIGRVLYEAMQPQTPNVSLPRQGWVLPVESHQTPKYSVKRNPLPGRSYSERSLSAYGRMAEDKGYVQSKKEKGEEAIEIVSEGSRTETPSVEIVSVVDDMDAPFSGNSSVKRVTFNPEATISAGSFARRTTDGSKWNDKSNSQRQEIDQLRRAKTDTSLLKVHKSKRNKENELRSKENDEEQKRYSFNEKRNSSLDSQRRIRSLSRTGNRLSPQRRFDRSFDATDSTVSSSVSMRRSRSPRASRRLLASWSYTPWSDSLDQHILLTDHQLKSTSNIEIRKWLEQKNRLLRKQRREERKLERMVQREESEKQREKNDHQLEYQEKARQWMKERKRENLLKKRLSKQLKASTSESYDFRQRSADRETSRANSLNKRKNGASRAKSAPVEMRERSRGKSAVREERARNKERQKKTAYQEWLKVDRENPKSSVIETHTENVTNDHVAEGRKARGRAKSAGKRLSKSVQLDFTDSENLHNKNSKVRISTQSSKDRLDPQGSDFKETSSSRGDAEREEDIRYNINSTKGDENSNDDIDRQTLDEENENEKDYENDYESELKEGASDNRSLTNERHHKDESHSGVDGEVDQKEESRARSRSYRSHSRTSSNSEHDEEASKNRNLTNKKKKESDSEVDGESDQKENSRVRSRSPGSDRQESRAERNESRSLSVREDGDKKKDLYDVDDRNDDSQSHRKRNSVDSTTSREYRDQTQTPPRNSSPKRRSEEQNSGSESDASETSGFVRKNKRKEMATQPSEDTEKQRIGSSRHSSKSREYENNPATPEASEENFRNRKSYSKEHSDKFARSSDHDTELQRIASRNSFNSNQNEERDNPVLRSSSRAKQTGDWTDYGETRAREETSPRNSKPPSGIFSSHSKNREVDADDRSQHDDDMDMLRRHSIVEDQPGEENRLGDTYSLGHHATEENLGNLTFRKSAHNENDEFSPFKAETRDLDSRNSAHIKNDEDLSFFKAETRDIASRNSINSKKYDELSTFKGETSKMASRNSAQSKNDEDDHIPFKTRDLASRNSVQSKNDDDHIPFKAESRNLASRNSAQSKNDEDHIPFKAESRNLASRNSIQSKNDDDHIPFKPMDLASRNSAQSRNDEDHISYKAETRDLASSNSDHNKKYDELSTFKGETSKMVSRNSAHSKNDDELSLLKGETRDIASRNSGYSQNDEYLSHFKPETKDNFKEFNNKKSEY